MGIIEDGILRMPPNLWSDDPIEIEQRYRVYCAAADELIRLRHRVQSINREYVKPLRDLVKKTWNPPAMGIGQPADVAQTATMQTLAFVFGRDFLGDLTEVQSAAIDLGLKMMNEVLVAVKA